MQLEVNDLVSSGLEASMEVYHVQALVANGVIWKAWQGIIKDISANSSTNATSDYVIKLDDRRVMNSWQF